MLPTRRRRLGLSAALALVPVLAGLLAVSSASGTATAAPSNQTAPSISGVPLEGNTLTGTRGDWSGTKPITYTYAWARCDENGANCSPISGADKTSYKLTSADIGSTIRFRVAAKNDDGSKTADSAPTAVVSNPSGSPVNSKAPTVAGSPIVGNQLTAAPGTWVGAAPITYSYQWLRCDTAGNACKNAANGTQAQYRVVKGDVAKTLRVKVTGKNSKGKSSAISEPTAVVQDVSGGGVITLPDGTKSIPVTDVPSDQRLIVDQVKFTPNPVTTRNKPITVKIRVKDTRGYIVRDAYVFIRSTPIVTSTPKDAQTATDGWITYQIQPESDFPIKNGYSVQFFVKAYRKGDKSLYGIYGSRLVQVATKSS
jgi:hypothetical protein